MREADFVNPCQGETAAELASTRVGPTGDIRDTPLRKIAGLHIGEPQHFAGVGGELRKRRTFLRN